MATITKTLSWGKGYRGKMGNRCWVAEITGMDSRYGFARDFLEPDSVQREHFNRPRTMIHCDFALAVDRLYELSEGGERWFIAVLPCNGNPRISCISDERLKSWADALDAGKTPREARLASEGL
jgi:hypothetical protein